MSPQQKTTEPVSTTKHRYPLRSNWQQRYSPSTTGHERCRGRAADCLHAQHLFQDCVAPNFSAQHIYNSAGKQQTLDALLASPNGDERWLPALSNEWGRLAQGNIRGVESTDTIDFIPVTDVPLTKKVTYASFACDHRPLKDEQWRVRIVVGGDKLDYFSDTGSPAADVLEPKLLFNSVISDAKDGAKFCSMDLKDMLKREIPQKMQS